MNHKAKKSLGQNFLKSKKIVSDIIDVGDIHADDIILEIGPGKGILTEKLLFFASKVIAVEKDRELVEFLKEKFKTEIEKGKLDLIEKDILDFDPELLRFYKTPYKLIANIPYNITGAIFKKFLQTKNQPEKMVLLIQKEVAERIIARDKKESILSISVKTYGKPKIIKKVGAGNFSPKPKVDSAVLLIDDISKKNLENIDEKIFFEILKTGFAHKRKLLIKNLSVLKPDAQTNWEDVFEKCGINTKSRPENLTMENWLCFAKIF